MKVVIFMAIGLSLAFGFGCNAQSTATAPLPIPDKLVVLTFDDSVKSHYTVARPVLKKYGFGATFFITEGFSFNRNKKDYMTWQEIAQLHNDGFEIGNHTRNHMVVNAKSMHRLDKQLSAIENKFQQFGIPQPVSFAWPGNAIDINAFDILKAHGIHWARRGGSPEYPRGGERGFPYEPNIDHPLLIPSAGIAQADYSFDEFVETLQAAKAGKAVVLQFHGVPDIEHPWVTMPQKTFEKFMAYLHQHHYKVIALRDLSHYVDWKSEPEHPMTIINKRKAAMAK